MFSQKELAERFANGEESGYASNVHITRLAGGWTALVGYGWAVYAVNTGGRIVAYRNWHGYSPSTSSQLTRMGISHPADTCVPSDTYRERAIVDTWLNSCATLDEFDESALAEQLD